MRRLRPKDSAEGPDASISSSLTPFPLTIHTDGRDISAASFQETTRVLTEASISGKVDPFDASQRAGLVDTGCGVERGDLLPS